jgi:hypothetical protein
MERGLRVEGETRKIHDVAKQLGLHRKITLTRVRTIFISLG